MAKARGKPTKPNSIDRKQGKKKNLPPHSPTPTAAAAFDVSRFTVPQRGYRSSIRWFDQLSVAAQDYLLEVAALFQAGKSTWTIGATFDQLREELSLTTSKSTFVAFLRGIGSYRNFIQEVQDARADKEASQVETDKVRWCVTSNPLRIQRRR
jgi:hypothetical protein